MTNGILAHGWPFLVSVSLKSLFVLALAALAALALRRASAAARHLAWSLGIVGLLLLFALALVPLPATWQVPLWPQAALTPHDAPVVVPNTEPHPDRERPLPLLPKGEGMKVSSTSEAPSLLHPFPGREGTGRLRPGLGLWGLRLGSLWPLLLFTLWLLGAAFTLLPTLIGLVAIARLARQSRRVTDGPLPELLTVLARDLKVTWTVRLLLGEMTTPMTWGWLRPVILLPENAEEWPEDRLRAVLLHELAHIARADWPAQMAAQLACALYWWNPGVWLAARQARLESERACDDRVLLAGVSAADYARHLLDIARSLQNKTFGIVVPMAQKSTVETRMRVILQPNRKFAMLTRKTVTISAVTALVVLAPLAALRFVARGQANANALMTPSATGLDTAAQLPVPDRFAKGVSIQLVGIADGKAWPKPNRPWWDATGAVLPKPLLRSASDTFSVIPPLISRTFAFRVSSPEDVPVNLRFQPAHSAGFSSDGSWVGKMISGSQVMESQVAARNGGYRILNAGFPVGMLETDVRVGIGEGPWSATATDTNISDGTGSAISTMTYIFSPVTPTEGGSVVTISLGHTPGEPLYGAEDLRVVALDNHGNQYLPMTIGDTSFTSVQQVQAQFALPPSTIKSIRLETRPYHWETFHNVALNPVKG
jgi:beta-lactamase regulating signal transducer with metallopeptidase domain